MSIRYFISILSALALLTVPYVIAAPTSQVSSQSTVHIIAARGTSQDPGPGSLITIAQKIASQVTYSTITGVDYPATRDNPPYANSVHTGAVNLQSMIRNAVAVDSTGSIVLLGYSQGAQVVGDAICGSSSPGSNTTTALAQRYSSYIKAVVWTGDPSHNASQTFVRGGGYHNGVNARRSNINCTGFGGKIRSYCIDGDVYCDSGKNASAHGLYNQLYAQQAADWVVSKL